LRFRREGGKKSRAAMLTAWRTGIACPKPAALNRVARGKDMNDLDNNHQHGERSRPEIRGMLRRSGLRPTRQRVALAELLYGKGNRHISAERLHEEAMGRNVPVSLATVYNTLHQFTEAGLLREVAVDGSKTYFDTNVNEHHHYFVEGENNVLDIPGEIGMAEMPEAPEGYEIARVDVIVRLRKKD
jgi:Fur family iron response transcriptional regulator